VIFLTDGLPTDGETNEAKIVALAKSKNEVRARIFGFGVGYDVNSRLIDKLVRSNFGQSEYVKPNEDIEARVSAFYNRIGSPVMTEAQIGYEFDGRTTDQGSAISRVYPSETQDLFAGEQLVLLGRYKQSGAAKVVLSGKLGSEQSKFDFPADFVAKSSDDSNAFVEKLWAVRRVGEIIDQLDLKGRNEELVNELVQLSTKHGILTPYTAFLADENTAIHDVAGNAVRANSRLDRLNESSGQYGFAQRSLKGSYQRSAQVPASLGRGSTATLAADQSGIASGAAFEAIDADTQREQAQIAQNVVQVGRKTFYQRANRWIDAEVTPAKEKKATKVERFSDAYFALVAKHGKDVAKYLSIEGPVVIELDGTVYEF